MFLFYIIMTQKVKEKLEYCNNNLSDDVIIETFVSKTKCGNFRPNTTYTKYINNYPNIINYIFNRYTNGEKNINEILYRILYNINILPVCKECGKPVKFISFFNGYQTFCCIHCIRINKDTNEKRRKTCFEKYGSKIYVNTEKAKQTCKEKYGNENYRNTEKAKQTCKEKYGVENVSQTDEHKEKVKQTNLKKYGVTCTFQAEQIKYKAKQTNLERYGVEYSSQNKEIKEKAMRTNLERYGQKGFNKEKVKQTNLERYGVENSMQVEEIKLKQQNTMVERYGQATSWNHGILREKQYQTCMEKYGVKHYAQTDEFRQWNSEHMKSPEIQKKILETKRKNNSFHSSKLEQEFKNYLEQKYINDIEFQYKSKLYPI